MYFCTGKKALASLAAPQHITVSSTIGCLIRICDLYWVLDPKRKGWLNVCLCSPKWASVQSPTPHCVLRAQQWCEGSTQKVIHRWGKTKCMPLPSEGSDHDTGTQMKHVNTFTHFSQDIKIAAFSDQCITFTEDCLGISEDRAPRLEFIILKF